MLTQTQNNELMNYFRGKKEIVAAYLYGSHARGTENVLSDIDIAIMVPYVNEATHKLHLHLIGDLTQILQTDEVDVKLLSPQTAPALGIRMLQGKLIFCRSESEKIKIAAAIFSRYQDFQPFLKYQITQMESRLQKGTYAHR